jgi:DNA modification methylase
MPVSVASYLIENFTKDEAVVLDPMVGSGTTVVAAQKLGRTGIGFDRDPLALLVAGSTTQGFDSGRLAVLKDRILATAQRALKAGKIQMASVYESFSREDADFIRFWFPEKSQEQLFALAGAIRKEPLGPERNLAWVVFSSLIIAKSAGASYALDISRSRPHKEIGKLVVLPFDGWDRRFRMAMSRLSYVDREPPAECLIRSGDARSLPLDGGMVDLVLTSPPYFNAIDYLRAHKFSLVWMGHKLEFLRDLRGTMIGSERGLYSLDGLPPAVEDRIHFGIERNRKRALTRRYLSDVRKMLCEIQRVLRCGGLVLLVVGPTIISTKKSDAVGVISEIARHVGLETVGSVARKLNLKRRSLPLPSRRDGHSLSLRMRQEVIVAFRK